MQYRFTRTIGFNSLVDMGEALPVCLKIVEYINKVMKMEAHLMSPTLGGHPGRLTFVVNFEDMNAFQAAQAGGMKDKKYVTLVGQLGKYVDGSRTSDQTWKIIV